jgi:type I restriction enzyme R subunit
VPVTLEEYKERLAARLVAEATTLEEFRTRWIAPAERRDLLGRLPDGGRSAELVRQVENMKEYDLYDVLAELGYGLNALTRPQRVEAFGYKHAEWLRSLPQPAARTLRALASQFAASGTEALESPDVFNVPDVRRAAGLKALGVVGEPAEVLRETKDRLFAA